jgi:predicted HTH transcriptional regulator
MAVLIYIIAVTVAFIVGRMSVKHPMPLSVHELQELRREKGNSIHARIDKSKARILDLVERTGEVTNDDVEDLLLVSDSTARRYLHELVLEGELLQIGDVGRGVYYVSKDSVHGAESDYQA